MYTREILRKKNNSKEVALEFRLKYYFNGERGRRKWDVSLLGENKWFSGKRNGPLVGSRGVMVVWDNCQIVRF